MKVTFRVFLLVAFPLIAPVVSAQVQASLSFDRSATISGMPVSLSITVSNQGSVSITLPAVVAAVVTPSGGDPFIDVYGWTDPPNYVISWPVEYGGENRMIVPAGSTRVFEIPFYQNVFFRDSRMTGPGTYRIQLAVADRFPMIGSVDARLLLSGAQVVTNPATIVVDRPRGTDAEAWEAFRRISGRDEIGPIEW